MNWQPIETAPKSVVDGNSLKGIYLLGYCPEADMEESGLSPEACIDIIWWEPLQCGKDGKRGVWRANAFSEAVEVKPTHWMPLPEPPSAELAHNA